jgi:hypothetical protein
MISSVPNARPKPLKPSELQPYELEVEKLVLGGLMAEPERLPELAGVLAAADFFRPVHGALYTAIGACRARGMPTLPGTLEEELQRAGEAEPLRALPPSYLDELYVEYAVGVANLEGHARKIAARANTWRAARLLGEASTEILRGGDPDETIAQTRQALNDLEIEPTRGPEGFVTVAIADVPEAGPVKWLVHDLWSAQAVGIVGAEPKSYKTFLTLHLAVCIAAGKRAFNRFEVQQGKVLCFNAEDRPAKTRSRVERMACAMEIRSRDLDLHLIDVPALRLDDPTQLAKLAATVARLRPALVVLDPLRDLHGLDENDAQIVSALLAPLRLLQRQYGCSVMVVHHMAKAVEGGAPKRAGQRLRGSSALHGWVDSALYLQPTNTDDKRVTVEVEHRDAQSPKPFQFLIRELSTPTGDALWLDFIEPNVEKPSDIDARVLKVLVEAARPLTGRDLRTAMTGARAVDVDAAVQRLARARTITLAEGERVDQGGRTVHIKGWIANSKETKQ